MAVPLLQGEAAVSCPTTWNDFCRRPSLVARPGRPLPHVPHQRWLQALHSGVHTVLAPCSCRALASFKTGLYPFDPALLATACLNVTSVPHAGDSCGVFSCSLT